MSHVARVGLLWALTVILSLGTALLPRIPQNPDYHKFADQRLLFGVPHALDVLSNLPFALVGLAGLTYLLRKEKSAAAFSEARERLPYAIFFGGVVLTCFGSAYYHLAPDNTRLVWDRLPITIGFTAVVAGTISDHVSVKAGRWLLWPLLLAGATSVAYWRWGKAHSRGDLRPYGFVQYYSLVLILLLIVLFPSRYTKSAYLVVAGGWYVGAVLLEALDRPIFNLGHVVSGHTLKHLAAATSTWCVYEMLRTRTMNTGLANAQSTSAR
jgi:hypothetical protein